jgi:hypothetical protein
MISSNNPDDRGVFSQEEADSLPSKAVDLAKLLRVIDLRFEIRFLGDVVLPSFLGSTLRGGLGRGLRALYCGCQKDKTAISGAGVCPYHFIFETRVNDNAFKFLRDVPSVPHPYLIETPLDERKDYKSGECLSFSIRLFGDATDYAFNLIESMAYFGRQGVTSREVPFIIVKVLSADFGGEETLLYDGDAKVYREMPVPFHWEPPSAVRDIIRLNFLTPARLVKGRALRQDPDPELIFASIVRRIGPLLYYAEGISEAAIFADGRLPVPSTVSLSSVKLEWKEWRRFSNRQSSHMLFGGVVGELTLNSVPPDFARILHFGSFIHIGKQTSFGLGRYEVSI